MNKIKISGKRLELLHQLLQENGTPDILSVKIPRATISSHYPLSFAQQRLWFMDQLAPGSPFYNFSFATPLNVYVDVPTLEESLHAIEKRHASLRTVFKEVDGKPRQFITDGHFHPLETLDLTDLSFDKQQSEINRITREEAQTSFNLTQGPLFRYRLIRLRSDNFVFILTIHHIISDTWSLEVFWNELLHLYNSIWTGKQPLLPELEIQYYDFAIWQREWLKGHIMEQQLNYWKDQLSDLPDLPLHTDFTRPKILNYSGAYQKIEIPVALALAIKKLSTEEGVTLFMTLLSIFKILLFRYTHANDIAIGTYIANRQRIETEPLIGFFINTLILRSGINGNMSFRELLASVKHTSLKAYENQDIPFEKLVEELQPERDLNRNPLVQVVFQLLNVPGNSKKNNLPNSSLGQPYTTDRGMSIFDLDLNLVETSEGIVGHFEYSTELFSAGTISRMSSHFLQLIRSVVSDPGQRIGRLSLIGDSEFRQILLQGTGELQDFDKDRSLVELFDDCCEQHPERTALLFKKEQLSYRQLQLKSNELAHRLLECNLVSEGPVGLCLERSAGSIVSMLAILKAGHCWLPLDPSYPQGRLELMIADAGVKVIITDGPNSHRFHSNGQDLPEMIVLDAFDFKGQLNHNPVVKTDMDALAYIIYTSGSSGKPKAVMGTHKGLLNRLHWMSHAYPIKEGEVFCQKTSLGFVDSICEIFGPLLAGSPLVILEDEVSKDPDLLIESLARYGVSRLVVVPSLLRALLDAGLDLGSQLPELQYCFTSGEALAHTLARRFMEELPDCRLINLYGSSEVAGDVTVFEAGRQQLTVQVQIGKPISNTRLYVLDELLQPVPVGVPGELYVSSPAVARGYLNNAGATAASFLPDPFNAGGTIMYKTGDLVRYLPDGNLEFLGRIDNQVKIRGYRIELPEIESLLLQHPGVKEAALQIRENKEGDKTLVAFVVQALEIPASSIKFKEDHWNEEIALRWQTVWDETYKTPNPKPHDPDFNIIGWNSSYTGQPFSDPEMYEWVNYTVKSIMHLNPKNVLEIGCGTGLLLLRIAPHCENYTGTDFSGAALDYLSGILRERNHLKNVLLQNKEATDFNGIAQQQYDTVILNSVVQYFPGINYLLEVIQKVIKTITDCGSIFIGDVRNYTLLTAFHTSVEVQHIDGLTTIEKLESQVLKKVSLEKELVIDPDFFRALKKRFNQISHVEILLKHGNHNNELNCFRYDVVLHIGKKSESKDENNWLDWKENKLNIKLLDKVFTKITPSQNLKINGIPNKRLSAPLELLENIGNNGQFKNINDLRNFEKSDVGIDPESIRLLAEKNNYHIRIGWVNSNYSTFDVIVSNKSKDLASVMLESIGVPLKKWNVYANNPLNGNFNQHLAPTLAKYLGKLLPVYMVPSKFVLLDKMPMTANGKIDRKKLYVPDSVRSTDSRAYMPAENKVEEMLASIWSTLLEIEQIGREDNFFESGGHSLLATQLISRIRSTFQIEMPLRMVFEFPVLSEMAKRIMAEKEISGDSLLPQIKKNKRKHKQGSVAINNFIIEKTEEHKILPLSFNQQRLWFLHQLEPDNSFYNLSYAFPVKTALNIQILEDCINAIIKRHDILRTTFYIHDDNPIQFVHPDLEVKCRLIDVSGFSNDSKSEEVKRILIEETRSCFKLNELPLLRILLLKQETYNYLLVFTIHHIIFDGLSAKIFWTELMTLYNGYFNSKALPLPDLSIQYGDFAVWQREKLSGAEGDNQLSYWKNQLSDIPNLDIVTDFPRPEKLVYEGATFHFDLPLSLTRRIKKQCNSENVTLFVYLITVFNILLRRYSRQDDFGIGFYIANRKRQELESLVGFFVNVLVLRVPINDNLPFSEHLALVKEKMLEAYENEDIPFEKLVEVIQPDRSLNRSPLIQVAFQMLNASDISISGGDSDTPVAVSQLDRGMSIFDLDLNLVETSEGIVGHFEYSTELFSAGTISRMSSHFLQLIRSVVSDPGQRIGRLSLIGDSEFRQILLQGTGELQDFDKDRSLVELFDDCCEQHPERTALLFKKEQLSYRQLQLKSNELAHRLLECNLVSEGPVGLCLERSAGSIVSMLAILKAGHCWLPLDPSYPQGRLELMIADAGVKVIITDGPNSDRFHSNGQDLPEIIVLDAFDFKGQLNHNPVVKTDMDALAYIIYTSGSSGKPKAVMGTHKGLLNRLHWMSHAYPIKEGEVFCQKTSLGFVDSICEIFGPLLAGSPLVILEDEVSKDPDLLIESLARYGVSRLVVVPSLLRALLDAGLDLGSQLPELRYCFTSGEALAHTLARRFMEELPDCRLINLYGSSEVAGDVTVFEAGRQQLTVQVQIGKPISNTRLYVLDELLQPVPVGVPGELYVSSPAVARGYLNNAGATAASFLPDPFNTGGTIMYKTGDLVRYLPDGNLEFLGRIDNQVKIRGYRIELPEIESLLLQHPGVKEAALQIRENKEGDKTLVAFVVQALDERGYKNSIEQNDNDFESIIKSYLNKLLPSYMVPSKIFFIEKLPLNSNGKIDRNALITIDVIENNPIHKLQVLPVNETEEELIKIWSKLLEKEEISTDDDFFKCGGHSLMATRLISQIRERFQIELPLRTVFGSSVLSELAKSIIEWKLQNGRETIQPAILIRRKRSHLKDLENDPKSFKTFKTIPIMKGKNEEDEKHP